MVDGKIRELVLHGWGGPSISEEGTAEAIGRYDREVDG